ncbi:MAG: hypothetical protein WCS87_08795 [Methylococcaceae bacterium]
MPMRNVTLKGYVTLPCFLNWVMRKKFGSSDSGVINKIVKKQYDIPINHLADSKIITTFLFL